MKLHAGDLILCKLDNGRPLLGVIEVVNYHDDDDWKNNRPSHIQVNGKSIHISELLGKQLVHVPVREIDDFISSTFLNWDKSK